MKDGMLKMDNKYPSDGRCRDMPGDYKRGATTVMPAVTVMVSAILYVTAQR